MIKVANIIEEGRYGGPQARITFVAEKLQEKGIETIVIMPKKNSELFYKKLTDESIPVRRLDLHRLTRDKFHLFFYLFFFVYEINHLYRVIGNENVDIVHCNGSWQFKGVIAGKLARKKVIWHLNDTYMPLFIHGVFNLCAKYLADGFILAGNEVKKYYITNTSLSGKLSSIIQAPVDTRSFDPSNVEADMNIVKLSGIKIITVGNLNPTKGLEYFIEMVALLNSHYNGLSFIIVGAHLENQSRYSIIIQNLAEKLNVKNLVFYGASQNMPSVLKAADIYICSSISEASPMSVWEAMSMGKAIVSTNVGDVAQFINDGENGFIVPAKDPKALTDKVGLLLENELLRKNFGQKARDMAVRHLDIDICVEKHRQIYNEVLDKGV